MLCGQIVAGVSAPDQEQRGGASHSPPAPAGFDWHQHGYPRRGQHPAADHRGQPAETMNAHHSINMESFYYCLLSIALFFCSALKMVDTVFTALHFFHTLLCYGLIPNWIDFILFFSLKILLTTPLNDNVRKVLFFQIFANLFKIIN